MSENHHYYNKKLNFEVSKPIIFVKNDYKYFRYIINISNIINVMINIYFLLHI